MAVVTLFGMPPHSQYLRLKPPEMNTVVHCPMYGYHNGNKMVIIEILLFVLRNRR